MSARLRAVCVAVVVAAATLGEGGAAPSVLLGVHLVLAVGAAVFLISAHPSSSVPERAPAMAWAGFVVCVGFGALVAPYAYAAWLVIVEIAAFGALAWLACGESDTLARMLPPALAVVAGAHGVAAVAQRLAGASRPASSFLNPSHLGAWLAAAMLVVVAVAMDRGRTRRAHLAYAAAAVLSLAGIFVSGSRGTVVGLAAGAASLVALSWGGLAPAARRRWIAGAAVLLLAAGAGVAARFRTDLDPYKFHRSRIWPAALQAVAATPLRGTGPGQFAAAAANLNFPLDETPLRYERGFRTPHSDLLRAVCEFGLPGGVLALAACGLLARSAFKRRGSLSTAERGGFAGLAALAAQGLVDDLSTRPAVVLLAAALAGILLARPREKEPSRSVGRPIAVLLLGVLGIGEIAGYRSWSELHVLPRGRLDDAQLEALRSSIAWNPMQPAGYARLAEHAVGDGKAWRLEDYALAREAAEHARRLQPVDAIYTRQAARVEASACLSLLPFVTSRERATELYEQAHALSRYDATIPLEESKFLLQAGDLAGARLAAEHALRIEPKAAVPRLWLAKALLGLEGAAAASRAKTLVDEAEALALPAGAHPLSPYDASLRAVDPSLVASLRSTLEELAP
jgi:O-antigen ligase